MNFYNNMHRSFLALLHRLSIYFSKLALLDGHWLPQELPLSLRILLSAFNNTPTSAKWLPTERGAAA